MPMRPPAGFISANYDPLRNPDAPTGVTAAAGNAQATVSFTAPANVGGSAISAYYAVSNPSQITTTGASSPITVTGLTNGTAYTFQVWALNTFGPGAFSAASGSVTPAVPPRVVFGGGQNNVIQYVALASTGNTSDFGDLSNAAGDTQFEQMGACASTTRGIFAGGFASPNTVARIANIQYITIATTGNATSFGSLSTANSTLAACNSGTRGVFGGGQTPNSTNAINYITISTTGNSTTFGQLTVSRDELAALSSPTIGVFCGGKNASSIKQNVIDYVTIATTGNATDFGDLTGAYIQLAAASNSTRGIIGSGNDGTNSSSIQYITIATTGNATFFGNLTVTLSGRAAVSSTSTVAFAGGSSPSSNVIDKVTIATTGNATDFGDLLQVNYYLAGLSAGNGGL